jgi:hypothetical protein
MRDGGGVARRSHGGVVGRVRSRRGSGPALSGGVRGGGVAGVDGGYGQAHAGDLAG